MNDLEVGLLKPKSRGLQQLLASLQSIATTRPRQRTMSPLLLHHFEEKLNINEWLAAFRLQEKGADEWTSRDCSQHVIHWAASAEKH